MNAEDPEKTTVGSHYPIQYIAPLPLEECVNRIRQSFDKRMGMSFAFMRGNIQKINESSYEFSLYQNLKYWKETVEGRFVTLNSSTTQVEASFSRGGSSWRLPPEKEKFLIPIIIITTLLCGFMTPMPYGLIIAIIIAATVGFIQYTNWKRMSSPPKPMPPPASELLWYFERTLKQ